MSKLTTGILALLLVFCSGVALAASFRQKLCQEPQFYCLKVAKGQSWKVLFPDPYDRDLVKRINRMNTGLQTGMTIAVPRDMNTDISQFSPFPPTYDTAGVKTVVVAPAALAWVAYDENGQTVRWGPVSGGQGFCKDIGRGCRTPAGTYMVYDKGGPGCVSSKYPIGEGGAPMPYCMFFHGGYALHGSPSVPGYNASHGCVRLFTEDARWLNQVFTPGGSTRVIVLPY